MEPTYADLVAKYCDKKRPYAYRDLKQKKRIGRRVSDRKENGYDNQ